MRLHEKIESIRISKGVTKTAIAKKCNKSVAWYHGISTGRRTANVDSIQEIAKALDVHVKVFFEEKLSDTLNNVN
jgi:transcriptional regulator with XRE-family HTH domain